MYEKENSQYKMIYLVMKLDNFSEKSCWLR